MGKKKVWRRDLKRDSDLANWNIYKWWSNCKLNVECGSLFETWFIMRCRWNATQHGDAIKWRLIICLEVLIIPRAAGREGEIGLGAVWDPHQEFRPPPPPSSQSAAQPPPSSSVSFIHPQGRSAQPGPRLGRVKSDLTPSSLATRWRLCHRISFCSGKTSVFF